MSKEYVIVQNSVRTTAAFRKPYIKLLLKKGRVFLVAPNDCPDSEEELKRMGVHIYRVPQVKSIFTFLSSVFISNFLIIKHRFRGDIFICHFLVTLLMNYFSLTPFNKRLLIYVEGLGSLFTQKAGLQRLVKLMLKANKGKVLFCNNDEKRIIGSYSDIVTGGIGVDLNKFKLVSGEVRTSDELRLLYVGRLIKDKGVEDVLSVFEKVLAVNSNVKLVLVGERYANNPSSLTLDDIDFYKEKFKGKIDFVGYKKDVRPYYKNSDALLLPSKREGFPVSAMEANAYGLPVLGYNVPGVKDAIVDGINGVLVEYGNIALLSKATLSLLNEQTLSDYRRRSYEYAINNFNAEDKALKLVNLLDNLHS
ncbi:glycosyltransferase [Salinivibrio costicola]|uniref:Glycosyltransferase family 4 protein n=1 Tax=Salinivibrio costicola TaxID=51367 RepID=A0ABX6K4M0_SALCS|nr:glycosyltransferase [Salinivibrio costicola]QIR06483.1 glycosyltransferase family 4 protein [Salinivibrio costicola]